MLLKEIVRYILIKYRCHKIIKKYNSTCANDEITAKEILPLFIAPLHRRSFLIDHEYKQTLSKCIQLLVKGNGKISANQVINRKPLILYALQYYNLSIFKLLVKRGASSLNVIFEFIRNDYSRILSPPRLPVPYFHVALIAEIDLYIAFNHYASYYTKIHANSHWKYRHCKPALDLIFLSSDINFILSQATDKDSILRCESIIKYIADDELRNANNGIVTNKVSFVKDILPYTDVANVFRAAKQGLKLLLKADEIQIKVLRYLLPSYFSSLLTQPALEDLKVFLYQKHPLPLNTPNNVIKLGSKIT